MATNNTPMSLSRALGAMPRPAVAQRGAGSPAPTARTLGVRRPPASLPPSAVPEPALSTISTSREYAIDALVRDGRALSRRASAEFNEHPEFLPMLTEAPDFTVASAFLLTELARVARSERGFVSMIDVEADALVLGAHIGVRAELEQLRSVPLNELSHPLVAVALGMQAARTRGAVPRRVLPFERWIALPLPQPLVRGAPAPVAPQIAAEMLAHWGAQSIRAERRPGQVPAGVVVLDAAALPDRTIAQLVRLAALAGPVLTVRSGLDSARREAERLRREWERLTVMMNALPDPIVITDGANNILVQNRRAEHLLAARDADSAGRRRALELNNLLFTSGLTRAVMTAGARTGPRELNLVDPDEGADLLFELLAHPLAGEAEREDAVLSVLRDVTDLRRASNELQYQVHRVRQAEVEARAERDRLNLILENVADPILVTDHRANIILMNDQAEQLFQVGAPAGTYDYRAEQAVLANDTKFASFVSEFALASELSLRERMMLTRPHDGTALPVEVVSGKIRNERGEPVAIVSVLHDLTQQVENERLYRELKSFSDQLEARVRAATADLEAQNEQLIWQSREVEKANKLKSEFMASMSHELRTPINAIVGHSALILDEIYGPLNARQADGLRRIRAAAQDLLALINGILDLAKIEAGRMSLDLEPVDLRDVIAELTQQIEPMVQKRGLTFTTHVADDTPLIETDRQKIKQVLANLLSNSIKFTPRGGITVAVAQVGESVQLAVTDTGIGIKPEHLDVIWEDFRQVDQSKTREVGGTGLGLSIVRKLLERLGGAAVVTSEYGAGSTFTVRLPLRASRSDESSGALTALAAAPRPIS